MPSRSTPRKKATKSTKKEAPSLRWPAQPQGTPATIDDFPGRGDFPTGEAVTVIFQGLLAFCYNRRGECEVGAFNKAADHKVDLRLYEVTKDWSWKPTDPFSDPATSRLIYSYPVGDPSNLSTDLILDVVKPRYQGVSFYQPNGTFCRLSDPPPDRRDFRWLLDLERGLAICRLNPLITEPEFYYQKLDKDPDSFNPRLRVKHGFFYTLERTMSSFILKGTVSKKSYPLGQVAHFIAANIYLAEDTDAHVSLQVEGQEFTLRKKSDGGRYIIFFANGCNCKYDPKAIDKKDRNDFFHYFEVLDVPKGDEEYELIIDSRKRKAPGKVFIVGNNRSSDDAPCAGAGFGQTPGLP